MPFLKHGAGGDESHGVSSRWVEERIRSGISKSSPDSAARLFNNSKARAAKAEEESSSIRRASKGMITPKNEKAYRAAGEKAAKNERAVSVLNSEAHSRVGSAGDMSSVMMATRMANDERKGPRAVRNREVAERQVAKSGAHAVPDSHVSQRRRPKVK